MKKLFYAGIACLVLFEIANVYFIMPMPGSQRMDSLDLAYFLHQWRWVFRGIFATMLVTGSLPAVRANQWLAMAMLILTAAVCYLFNFYMSADAMFIQTGHLWMADAQHNTVKPEKLVIGVEVNGEARAYPIQFLGYHHQVQDRVGGKPVMVTYCTVCRTGRVYAQEVNGKPESFRLVGMDHFNAMFEDETTGSWWRQVTGEAVEGPLRGTFLPELPSSQASLGAWQKLYPASLVMQPDSTFKGEYADLDTYDTGLGRGKLTGTDTLSWNDKSWVAGIDLKRAAKAYDWNKLKQLRLVQDAVGGKNILLALGDDNKSFFAFERPDKDSAFLLRHDTLFSGDRSWSLNGKATDASGGDLKRVKVYQEFWHSWRTFHPNTTRY
jgi:hypothetical protein